MACLRLLAVLLVLKCIAGKFVLPNDPLSSFPDIPREISERESSPLDTQISHETSLDEIKRLFETLDRMPAQSRSHIQSDDNDGPVAWYEPQQDEPLNDGGKCVDSFRGDCKKYVDNGQCRDPKFEAWMKSRCRKTCGYCEVNCWDTEYGCCPDDKTAAEGPNQGGCAATLCIDIRVCDKYKHECDDPSVTPQRKAWLTNYCAYTCRLCKKAPTNPKSECEANKPTYGCCWNGEVATGWNGKGCLPCEDVYVRACKLWSCDSPFYKVRTFLDQNCPKTCGRCGSCSDKQTTAKCQRWEQQGLCSSSGGWKTYLEEHCAKTCKFCGNVGVRSLLGLM